MKFLIKIDRSSIKENPDAGRTSLWVHGKTIHNEDGSVFKEMQQIHFMQPEPEYLYSYIDTQVQCQYCNAEFSWKDLETDEETTDDDETFLDFICPKCKRSDCCEIEREQL